MSARDVAEGVAGAGQMLAAFASPFRRHRRKHWGLSEGDVYRAYPGDELVPNPRWGWTHGIEIGAPTSVVWRWIAQIGADRAGFYSYEALENLAGCHLTNADDVVPAWQTYEGADFVVHPRMPPLRVASWRFEQYFVAYGAPEPSALQRGRGWVAVSWLFYVEPRTRTSSRFISRYRCDHAMDRSTRLSFGPALLEPIGFVMDRRMLRGVKERAEGQWRAS